MTELDFSYTSNSLILFISILASFLSGKSNIKKIWIISFLLFSPIILIIAYYLFYVFFTQSSLGIVFWINSIFLLVITIIAITLTYLDGMASKKSVNKKMIGFTKNIKSYDEIRLFAGDLSFLGNIKDGSIERNQQYIQLKDLCDNNACKIKVICHKPENSDFKVRLGHLLYNINNISIEFYNFRECKHSVGIKCENPDLNLRGRIISDSNGLEHIFLTDNSDKSSKRLKLFILNSASKDGRLYIKLWDLWWEKCEEDCKTLDHCKDLYMEYKKIIN